jgi:hypothetical protein
MGEILFCLKTMVFSVVFVALLQFQWQGQTLENRALATLHDSQLSGHLADIAQGAKSLSGEMWTEGLIHLGLKERAKNQANAEASAKSSWEIHFKPMKK